MNAPFDVSGTALRAKPAEIISLELDFKRVNEQRALVLSELREQREIADPQFQRGLKPVTPTERDAAADRVTDLNRQAEALRKTARGIQEKIDVMKPASVAAVDAALRPLLQDTLDRIRFVRDELCVLLARHNAISSVLQQEGGSGLMVPSEMPHLNEVIRKIEMQEGIL